MRREKDTPAQTFRRLATKACGVRLSYDDGVSMAHAADTELAFLRNQIQYLETAQESLIAQRDALTERAERAEKDKARLDGLSQSNDLDRDDVNDIVNGYLFRGKYYGNIRAAIDAALSPAPTQDQAITSAPLSATATEERKS